MMPDIARYILERLAALNEQDADACGAHNIGEAIPNSRFDYTCDDCMLPYNWKDFDEDPNYDNPSDEKRSDESPQTAENAPPF